MKLKKCILTANPCYKTNKKMTGGKPKGIVVHSTGANNKTVKRYVQPLKTDKDYNTIIADIGVNNNGNHWNTASMQKCVHAFIGTNAKGEVVTYQTLPYDVCCWGCGSGTKGSYNYNPQARVQFEICEDGLTDKTYFDKVFKEAIEYCAYLCKTYGFGVDKISSHAEAYKQGYGSNHGDCDNWLKKFGKNMDWFRAEVQKLLTQPTVKKEKTISEYIAVLNKAGIITNVPLWNEKATEDNSIYWLIRKTAEHIEK
jgi:N-acetylmuramoyl-L-alanine amidase CwlA